MMLFQRLSQQEMTGSERLSVMHGLMSTHRATSIELGTEQDRLPKVAHDRKMRFEAVHPYFRERLGKDLVDERLAGGWDRASPGATGGASTTTPSTTASVEFSWLILSGTFAIMDKSA